MGRKLFSHMVLRKLSEITNGKSVLISTIFFYSYEYFFFQPNQEHYSLCCSSPCFRVLLCTHYGLLQCFSTYFCKLKETRVLQPIFPDYVISCHNGFIDSGCVVL